jgi:hypothetical protein
MFVELSGIYIGMMTLNEYPFDSNPNIIFGFDECVVVRFKLNCRWNAFAIPGSVGVLKRGNCLPMVSWFLGEEQLVPVSRDFELTANSHHESVTQHEASHKLR